MAPANYPTFQLLNEKAVCIDKGDQPEACVRDWKRRSDPLG